MTDEPIDAEHAQDVAYDIDREAEEAIAALERGPDTRTVEDAIEQIGMAANEMSRQVETINQKVNDLSGGSYSEGVVDLARGADDAFDHVEAIREMAGFLEDGLEPDDGEAHEGTLDLGGRTYEVTMRPVEDEAADTPAADGFGKWLQGVMEANDLCEADIVDISVASEGHVNTLLSEDKPLSEAMVGMSEDGAEEVCTSILKGLDNADHISRSTRRGVVMQHGWTDSDVGVTEEDHDDSGGDNPTDASDIEPLFE